MLSAGSGILHSFASNNAASSGVTVTRAKGYFTATLIGSTLYLRSRLLAASSFMSDPHRPIMNETLAAMIEVDPINRANNRVRILNNMFILHHFAFETAIEIGWAHRQIRNIDAAT